MQINDDLTVRATVHTSRLPWVPSPSAGVDRRMLFRIGDERARATSIVRYRPGSLFPRHGHGGGEEFLVLDGTFQDEHGDYPAGSYVRNPPGSGHAPGAAGGCTIFVRLWQFRADDRRRIVCPPDGGDPGRLRPGMSAARILFDDGHERVGIERWQAGATMAIANPQGFELLVISGGFDEGGEAFGPGSWTRLPPGYDLRATVGAGGAEVWYKAGPLSPAACAL